MPNFDTGDGRVALRADERPEKDTRGRLESIHAEGGHTSETLDNCQRARFMRNVLTLFIIQSPGMARHMHAWKNAPRGLNWPQVS